MRKRKKGWIAGILLLIAIVIVVLVPLRITTITFKGNTYFEDERLTSMIFPNSYSLNPIYCFFESKYGKKKQIPFIETYYLEFISWNQIQVEVFEKSIAGYVEYKDYQIYFDNNGIVVESSKDKLSSAVKIEGLALDHIVLHEKLPLENEDIFQLVLVLTQTLTKYEIIVDKIIFDNKYNINLEIGGIRVVLGNDSYIMSEKIAKLSNLLPNLLDKNGILYMDKFNEDTEIFRFISSQEET